MKLVEVTWEDALRDNRGWDSAEAYREGLKNAPLMRSVGYLLVDDPAYTVLIQSHDSLDGVADALRIPRGMVREIRELRVESAEQG